MELSMADKLERYNFWQDPTRKKTKSPTIGRRLTAGASPVNPGIKVEKKEDQKKDATMSVLPAMRRASDSQVHVTPALMARLGAQCAQVAAKKVAAQKT
jgi:hypothetical protein